MNFTVGQRVWWHHTDECRLFGTVEVLEERPGVRPDGDPDLLYLDADQLYVGLPDGVYPPSIGYLSDPARLSPRGAKKLLEPGGPAKFQWERTQPPEHKPHFDFGRLVHLFVLGEGDQVALIDADGYTTKYAREQRDKAHADGLIPALRSQIDEAAAMASVVRQHPIAGPLLAEGDAEHWLYATEPETGQGLRMRLDWMTQKDRLYVVEYKTAADAAPRTFARKSYDYGYHVAAAFAVTCARALELDDSPAYLVIAQEKTAPYLVSVCEFNMDAYQLGKRQMLQAIRTFQECMESAVWPGYSPEVQSLSLPPWAYSAGQQTIGDLLATGGND
jgi:hypothetical protein